MRRVPQACGHPRTPIVRCEEVPFSSRVSSPKALNRWKPCVAWKGARAIDEGEAIRDRSESASTRMEPYYG